MKIDSLQIEALTIIARLYFLLYLRLQSWRRNKLYLLLYDLKLKGTFIKFCSRGLNEFSSPHRDNIIAQKVNSHYQPFFMFQTKSCFRLET